MLIVERKKKILSMFMLAFGISFTFNAVPVGAAGQSASAVSIKPSGFSVTSQQMSQQESPCQATPGQALPPQRPNILIIMADDLGFSDLGCYGGEIETPSLDGLAREGLRYKQFYNAARCCPSRAALMTGLYPHQAGMGWRSEEHTSKLQSLMRI